MLKYCLDRYKTQVTWDEAVDNISRTLKFVPNWFVLSKIIVKNYNTLFADDDILFFDEDSRMSHCQVMKWLFLA